jgi:hypothetical protein
MEVQYSELAKRARDQVRDLEEPFKSVAYETILKDLILEAKKSPPKGAKREKRPIPSEGGEDPVQIFLTSVVDERTYSKLFASKGKLVDKSIAVLQLARDVLGIDGLTASQISEILTKKYRVAKVHRQNVSNDLRKATDYVHRIQSGSDYKYLLMSTGEEHLKDLVGQY